MNLDKALLHTNLARKELELALEEAPPGEILDELAGAALNLRLATSEIQERLGKGREIDE